MVLIESYVETILGQTQMTGGVHLTFEGSVFGQIALFLRRVEQHSFVIDDVDDDGKLALGRTRVDDDHTADLHKVLLLKPNSDQRSQFEG